MSHANDLIKTIMVVGVLAVTVKLVEGYDKTAAWWYAIALLVGYAVTQPDNALRVTGFLNQVTKGA